MPRSLRRQRTERKITDFKKRKYFGGRETDPPSEVFFVRLYN